MTFAKLVVGAVMLCAATVAAAQHSANQVWGVRVLATDVEALATFYEKAFGMSEFARPVDTARTKELVLNFGATPELAKTLTATPIVIYTRPAGAPAGAMASLILRVPDLDKAIAAVKANGGTVMREPNRNAIMKVRYVFAKDPDGNQIELLMEDR